MRKHITLPLNASFNLIETEARKAGWQACTVKVAADHILITRSQPEPLKLCWAADYLEIVRKEEQ